MFLTQTRHSLRRVSRSPSLEAFHHHGNPLASPNTRRGQPVLLLPPPQLVKQRDHEPCSCRPERMPQRNPPAIDVYFLAIESQFFLYSKILRREGLVHFDQIDVIQSQPCALQRNLRRRNRTAPPHLRIDPRNPPIHDSTHRTQISSLRLIERHYDNRRSAIDNSAGIPRSDGSVLAESSPELRQSLDRRLRTPVIILSQHLSRSLTLGIPQSDRRQLLLQTSRLISLIGLLLRTQSEFILRLPSDSLLLAIQLSRIRHVHPAVRIE